MGAGDSTTSKRLPDLEDPNGELDEYRKLKKNLNVYFIPKKNKYYVWFMLLKYNQDKKKLQSNV